MYVCLYLYIFAQKVSKLLKKLIDNLRNVSVNKKTMQSATTQTMPTNFGPLLDKAMEAWDKYSGGIGKTTDGLTIDEFLDNYVDALDKSQYDAIFYEFGFRKLIDYMYDVLQDSKDTDDDLLDFSDSVKKFWVHSAICKCMMDREPYLKDL